jgi:hypothetical protein
MPEPHMVASRITASGDHSSLGLALLPYRAGEQRRERRGHHRQGHKGLAAHCERDPEGSDFPSNDLGPIMGGYVRQSLDSNQCAQMKARRAWANEPERSACPEDVAMDPSRRQNMLFHPRLCGRPKDRNGLPDEQGHRPTRGSRLMVRYSKRPCQAKMPDTNLLNRSSIL